MFPKKCTKKLPKRSTRAHYKLDTVDDHIQVFLGHQIEKPVARHRLEEVQDHGGKVGDVGPFGREHVDGLFERVERPRPSPVLRVLAGEERGRDSRFVGFVEH